MPTSASTGTEQTSTSGAKKASSKAKAAESETQTPDDAPVVTRPEDVVAGVRVNIPPDTPDPNTVSAHNQPGVLDVTRPDGSTVVVGPSEDQAEIAEAIRKGERHS